MSDEQQAIETELRQLQNRQKILLSKKSDAERKARTRRLIERGAILESIFPNLVPLTNEEVKALLAELSEHTG